MRLAAASRVRNEDDILEAFLRHHAALVDHHVLLDDGSVDATPRILSQLAAEGLALSVVTAESVWFEQQARNTSVFREAAASGADWVVLLDCDEFVAAPGRLTECLAAVPPTVVAVSVPLVAYHPTDADDATEPVVPLRLRHRAPVASDVLKVMVRGGLAAHGAEIMPGNHGVMVGGNVLPAPRLPEVHLAHYPVRQGWQMLAKAVVGRLKVLAAGPLEEARGSSSHYTELFEHLIHHPAWVTGEAFLAGATPAEAIPGGVVCAPLAYLGGALRYTAPAPPLHGFLRSVLSYAETLARHHGRLLCAREG